MSVQWKHDWKMLLYSAFEDSENDFTGRNRQVVFVDSWEKEDFIDKFLWFPTPRLTPFAISLFSEFFIFLCHPTKVLRIPEQPNVPLGKLDPACFALLNPAEHVSSTCSKSTMWCSCASNCRKWNKISSPSWSSPWLCVSARQSTTFLQTFAREMRASNSTSRRAAGCLPLGCSLRRSSPDRPPRRRISYCEFQSVN